MRQSIDGMRPATDKKDNKSNNSFSWAWVGMLFVVMSIGFSTYMVFFGTDNIVAKAMLAPQVVFAVAVAVYKFSR